MKLHRRSFLTLGLIGTAVPGAFAQTPLSGSHILYVGTGGDYPDLHQAMAAVSGASPTDWYVIYLFPGFYDLAASGAGPLVCKDYVAIVGADRDACTISASGNINIRYGSHNSFSNFTLKYSGTGNRSGGFRNIDTIPSTGTLRIESVRMEVLGPRCAVYLARLKRAEIRDCEIVTQGIGIEVVNFCGNPVLHDTDIWLIGPTGHPHYGLLISGYTRLHMWNGKLCTGYGYNDIANERSQDIIGVRLTPAASGRVELYSVWSIIRNHSGANAGVRVQNIRVEGPDGWVRVHGGYYGPEDPNGQGADYAFANPGGGRIEVFPDVVYSNYQGTIFQAGPALGVEIVKRSKSWSDRSQGGLKLCDATGGALTLTLSGWPKTGEEYIFKRIDTTSNPIIIDAATNFIEGKRQVQLPPGKYSTLHIRWGGGAGGNQWFVI
jgi:hypothetical protein